MPTANDPMNPQQGKNLAELAELPGEARVLPPLLDEAVAELNRIYVTKGLETARAIGEYVLEVFFDDDVGNFRDRGAGHVSFRELGRRSDLKVGWQFIWNAVAVVEQFDSLPADAAESLPLSHHKLLLTVKDESRKRELAQAALREHLGKREFEERVKAERLDPAAGPRAGRPPLPGFAKAATALRKVVKTATAEAVGDDDLKYLSREEVEAIAAELDAGAKELARVAAQVRSRLAAGVFPRGNNWTDTSAQD
jgi:hypothetical protein